ncbi:sugar transferase, partial [Campylobacter volucris]|nr:sugar transferase [Campylobacter volucris]
MLNPHSAVSRIKNQLAYKLGSCIIEHNANGGGYLSLIYKLYKIKKEYFKERKLYKQIIKIFPNLIYPDIKTLNDYNDSIRVEFHLSYMLGETLIKADKN